MGVVFDKLGFMRKLAAGGDFTRPQAEKLTGALLRAGIAHLKVWRVGSIAASVSVLASLGFFA